MYCGGVSQLYHSVRFEYLWCPGCEVRKYRTRRSIDQRWTVWEIDMRAGYQLVNTKMRSRVELLRGTL